MSQTYEKEISMHRESQSYKISYVQTKYNEDQENIVMMHGWLGDKSDYQLAIDEFGDDYNIIAFDMRGHGDSDAPLEISWFMKDLAQDLEEIVDTLIPHEKKITIIASSLSTAVALQFTKLNQPRVQQLILISPTEKFTVPVWMRSMAKLGSESFATTMLTIYEKLVPLMIEERQQKVYLKKIHALKTSSLKVQQKIIEEAILNYEVEPSDIEVPVLILAGDRDKVVSFQSSLALNDELQNSTLIVFENHKHKILSNHPLQVVKLTRLFLEEHERLLTKPIHYRSDLINIEELEETEYHTCPA